MLLVYMLFEYIFVEGICGRHVTLHGDMSQKHIDAKICTGIYIFIQQTQKVKC